MGAAEPANLSELRTREVSSAHTKKLLISQLYIKFNFFILQ